MDGNDITRGRGEESAADLLPPVMLEAAYIRHFLYQQYVHCLRHRAACGCASMTTDGECRLIIDSAGQI